eukprot:TRINITY_DN66347_c0_g1_i1.p1 TRINITY_DN66347_c0_g1~~TRINITY_DN66347_c0_g1_i1.p1  ORF type:complete len:124 (+),score=28.94 TRINITY_DN66347_c0_g1_i1:52-423(+)
MMFLLGAVLGVVGVIYMVPKLSTVLGAVLSPLVGPKTGAVLGTMLAFIVKPKVDELLGGTLAVVLGLLLAFAFVMAKMPKIDAFSGSVAFSYTKSGGLATAGFITTDESARFLGGFSRSQITE